MFRQVCAFHVLSIPVVHRVHSSLSRCRPCRISMSASSSATGINTQRKGKSKAVSSREVTPRDEDYSQWYLDIISSSDLAESSPVKGCLVIKPHGFEIWERLRNDLDRRIKAAGAKNAYFPLLIPNSFFSREAEHVEGFSKECAVVTHHRLRPTQNDALALEPDPEAVLEEPLVIRPTSETIIWHMFGKWIQSYRDLPLMINQWANVVRWELRTRPFLRTAEFLWQEGHTAHATCEEALAKAKEMIAVYKDVAEELLAIPVVSGRKSESERFPGAVDTYTIEAMMQNGWALQAGTSHFLGQSFAKAFNVKFKSSGGDEQLVWATSWGMSTRMVGAVIMTHSDDTGLVLPPKIAPIQVALVLIFKNDEQRGQVSSFAEEVKRRLEAISIRAVLDDRPNLRPGAKYYEWERKGVPLRMEIGSKDAAMRSVFAARRICGSKFSIPVDQNFEKRAVECLDNIQRDMYDVAKARLDERTLRPTSYDEMREALNAGPASHSFFLVPWCDNAANEKAVKEETKATLRCFPLIGQEEATGELCIYSGERATHMALFGRAY